MTQTSLIVLAGASLLFSSAATAADFTAIPLSTDQALPVAEPTAFDWTGLYAGIFTGLETNAAGTQFAAGVNVGVNAQFDFYLVGAEVSVRGLAGDIGETTYGQILGRAGLVVADDAVVYAAGGYGIDLEAPNDRDVLAGGGLELAVTDSVSLRAEYLRSFPTQGGDSSGRFTVGAQIHF